MPLHLPPLSRRRFLAGTLAAGAGWLTLDSRRVVWGADADRAHRWALFSDTHIAADPATTYGSTNMADNLRQATAELLAAQPLPLGLIVSGDCAFRDGQTGDYARLAELVAPVSKGDLAAHLLLGNHDHRQRFRDELLGGSDSSPLPDRHVAVVLAERANWFLLDSLRKTLETPGEIGDEQLAWLAKALDAHADKPAIVVGHHNPVIKGAPSGLDDTDKLFEVLVPRKQVKAYIFGHTHHWRVYEREGIHLVNLPPVAYPFNNRDPSGWVKVELREDGMNLELVSLDKQHPAHGEKKELAWRAA